MRHHTDWLAAYLDYTSNTEPPESYRFWSGVSTIASILRRKVYFDMGNFQWTPNFFIVFVAPPGIAGKSTTIRAGKALLQGIKGVSFGPTVMTWQALPKVFRAGIEMVSTSDGKIEATAPVTFTASELGALIDPKDKGMIDILVDIWDGAPGVWEKLTKSSGDDRIFNPWINIIAGTTPSWLLENYPKHMAGGGFTSRCIFIYANRKAKIIAYPMKYVDDGTAGIKNSLIADLKDMNAIQGRYILAPDAEAWGTQWYEELQQGSINSPLGEDQYFGWLSRKQSHVHKLAMIMTAAKTSELHITLATFRAAERLVSAIEPDIARIFSALHTTRGQEGTSRLIALVRQRRKIPRSNLYRLIFHYMNIKEFNEAIDSAVTAGYIYIQTDPATGQVCVYAKEEEK